MVDRDPGIAGRLNSVRKAIFWMRPETKQERAVFLDAVTRQQQSTDPNSEEYKYITDARRSIMRLPQRHRPTILGKDTPWFW